MAEKQDKNTQWTEMATAELKGRTPETLTHHNSRRH